MTDADPSSSGAVCPNCGSEVAVGTAICPRCSSSLSPGSPLPSPHPDIPSAPELRAGDTVGAGRFVLIRHLGRGGMGVVWMAIDRELSKSGEETPVALKFLSHRILSDPGALDMMRAELLNSRRLRHHYIVSLYELYVLQNEAPFVCMEFVDGENLHHIAAAQPGGVLRWGQLAPLVRQLGEGLEYAHREGVIHRDLKPGNIMVSRRGELKLADFGLAKVYVSAAGLLSDQTRPRGTLPYMSPQQLEGQAPRPTDDIYSLGATIYSLLTGTAPFRADDDTQLIEQVRYVTPDPIPDRLAEVGIQNPVPGHVKVIVSSCLQKDPRMRPQTVREVMNRLALAAAGAVELRTLERAFDRATLPPAWEEPAEETPPPRPWWKTVLAVAAWLLLAGVLLHPTVRTAIARIFGVGGLTTDRAGATLAHCTLELQPHPARGDRVLRPQYQLWRGKGMLREGEFDDDYRAAVTNLSPANYLLVVKESARETARSSCRELELPAGTTQVVLREFKVDIAANVPARVERTDLREIGQTVSLALPKTGLGLGGRYEDFDLVLPGTYRYRFEFAGYVPALTNIQVGNADQSIRLQLSPVRSLLPTESSRDVTPIPSAVSRILTPQRGKPWVNSLGMAFIPLSDCWMCTTETTVKDYREFVRATQHPSGTVLQRVTARGWEDLPGDWQNPGFTQGDNHPVVGVRWNDAVAFCEWLTRQDQEKHLLLPSQRYQLPTDAQWTAAAGPTRFPAGNQYETALPKGNYSGPEAMSADWYPHWPTSSFSDGFPRTAPVGSFPASPNGLFDLGGNVAEWCVDLYSPNLNAPETLRALPPLQDAGNPTDRVVRGASWFDHHPDDLQSATRHRQPPDRCSDRVGFRVVVVE